MKIQNAVNQIHMYIRQWHDSYAVKKYGKRDDDEKIMREATSV